MRYLIDAKASKKRPRDEALQWAVNAEVHQLIELLREAKSGGVSQAFAAALKDLADHGPEIERGIVAWIQLIEILLQGAEQRYPEGNGAKKKAQVRAALHYLYGDNAVQIPGIPRSLEPLAMDILIDWSINALVDSLNTYSLWDDSKPDPWSPGGMWRALGATLLDLMSPLFDLLNWLYVKLRYSQPLTPEVLAALDRVKAQGLVRDKSVFFRSAADLLKFVAQHGQQVAAGVRAFFEVVAMAERLASASNPEKKAYATAIVKATLQELGFPVESGLIGMIADAVISAGIESALNLFQTRAPENFRSRSALRDSRLRARLPEYWARNGR
ncbi:MAG TPA: hypothetical protein VGC36_07640 [Rhizomicrobium sp.]